MSAVDRYRDTTKLLDELFHELALVDLGLVEPDEPLPAHSELQHRELLRKYSMPLSQLRAERALYAEDTE